MIMMIMMMMTMIMMTGMLEFDPYKRFSIEQIKKHS